MGTIRDLLIRLAVDPDVADGLDHATSMFSSAQGKFKAAALGIGTAAGAAIGKGLVDNMSIETANDKLSAQLGLTKDESARIGKVAGDLYAGAYGDSLADVNEAIHQVVQNVGGMSKASSADLQKVTGSVMDVASAFDQDLGGVTRAVGQAMKTGMAKDATEALDIITAGFQKGVDKSGDLLDTFNEYGTQFRKLGLSGTQAMGLLHQGLEGGARDADVVADAIKEFSIRAIDGSDATRGGFMKLGLDTKLVSKNIAAGGETAAKTFNTVLLKLRGIEDPAKRNAAAVALFGTQAEDLGEALFKLEPSKAVADMGQVGGAAQAMGQTLADNAETKITTMQRSMQQMLQSVVAAPGPLGAVATALTAFGAPALAVAGDLGNIINGFGGLIGKAASAAASVAVSFGGMVVSASAATYSAVSSMVVQGAKWVWLGAQSLAQAARVALAWLIAMGPIAIVIAAVIALVALIIANWDTIKEYIGKAWEWVKNATKLAWDWILNAIKSVVNFIVGLFLNFTPVGLIIKHWETIKTATSTAWQWVLDKIKAVVNLIVSIFLNFTPVGMIIKHWDTIKSATASAWQWIVDKIKGFVNNIIQGIGVMASLPGKVAGYFSSLAKGAIDKGTELLNWVKKLPSTILGYMGNMGNILVNAGRNLLSGFWNGISAMAGWLRDRIYGFFSSIMPDWVKSALGIASPSKVFAFLGKFTMLGFGKGFKDSAVGVLRIASDTIGKIAGIMAQPIDSSLSMGISGSATPAFGGTSADGSLPVPQYSSAVNSASGSGGGVVIENLTLQFADDRDMYQKGQEFAEGLRHYKRRGGVIPA